jgi:hypothetical protein
MGRLDHAIAVLDVLGSVVQAVPVVGDGLKSATEVVTKICDMVKVRSNLVRHAVRSISLLENEREPRSLRGSCGSRSPATRSCRGRDLDREDQSGEAEEHERKPGAASPVRSRSYHLINLPDATEQHAPGYQADR